MCNIKQKYIEELNTLHNSTDEERAHDKADDLLCKFLTELGYVDVVEAFNKVPKYYA